MTRVLVTGGGGFLGGAIVRLLLARGERVRVFQRRIAYDAPAGAECVAGDIAHAETVARAVADCDSVIHTAAKAGVWGRRVEYERVNVQGTRNVVEACVRHDVRRLVHTSSPSVVFAGRDESGIDERTPYPRRFLADYPRTKAAAERIVLAANSPALATIALRPHLIWGPGDPHLLPRLVDRAARGRLRIVGDGANLVDSTYIDNAAAAHVAALDRLDPASACAGRAYFITNGEPLPIAELIGRLLAAAGAPPVTRRISPRVAYTVATMMEWASAVVPRLGEPPLTRFVVRQLAAAHWFDLAAARRDLGYAPAVSLATGFQRLAEHWRDKRRHAQPPR